MPYLPTKTAIMGRFQSQSTLEGGPGLDVLHILDAHGQVVYRVCGDGSIVRGVQPTLNFSTAAVVEPSIGQSCWQCNGANQSVVLQTPNPVGNYQFFVVNNSSNGQAVTVTATTGLINSESVFSLPYGQSWIFGLNTTGNYVATQDQ